MPDNYLTGVAPPATVPSAGNSLSGRYAGKKPEDILRMLYAGGFTQEGVDALYAARGLANPPQVPTNAVGFKPGGGRNQIVYGQDGKPLQNGAGVRDFLNTFNTTAVDPFRVRSGISNLAGGILNGVGSYVGGPVWQAFTAVADAGNRALGHDDGTSYIDGRRSGSDRAGAAIGAIAGSFNGPGSYGANNPGVTDPTGGAPGTQAGPTTTGGTGGIGGILGNTTGSGMNWTDWINLAGQLGGAYAQYQGASDAANAQAAGSAAGIAEQRRQYDQSRADQLPWLASGVSALGRLNDPTAFTQSPGYNFVRSEGNRDLGNSFAARGGALSGNALRGVTDYNQNLASQEYNNWFNQQSNLAGLGQTSAQSLGSLGANSAGNISNLLGAQANARASGIAGQTNALTGGIGDFLSWYNRRGP